MRPIKWLHISDLHLREGTLWSQDAVLRAMLEDIDQRVADGAVFDFVLITGDLAFSGQGAQYVRVGTFLDELASRARVARHRMFCVPGNHDVDRNFGS